MTVYCKSGYAIVTVLVFTALGLLFGAGTLLLFRYQCQMRIDRQHEFEKVYAVRSALNFARVKSSSVPIPVEGLAFGYRTGSGRDLNLIVKPAECVFPALPSLDNGFARHFFMEKGNFQLSGASATGGYDDYFDYECGSRGVTNLLISSKYQNSSGSGLAFMDSKATNYVDSAGNRHNARWWVNIGMKGTGGWLEEDYGRRYCFLPRYYVAGGDSEWTKDIVRLCIIRNVTNVTNKVGDRYGWPLSQEGERAIVFEINPHKGVVAKDNNATMSVFEYWYENGSLNSKVCIPWINRPSNGYMGLQLAGDKVTVFYISNTPSAEDLNNVYSFWETPVSLSPETYYYFHDPQTIGGVKYGGMYTNEFDKLKAPELRAVFEVEAASNKRPTADEGDYLTNFRVTPAYQYSIWIEHPSLVTNLATVAQKIGEYNKVSPWYRILTYDTHGTENKGFRKDERLWAEAQKK